MVEKAGPAVLQVEAVQSLIADPSALSALSSPSRLLVDSLRTGVETVLASQIAQVKSTAIEVASAAVAEAVGATVADVMSAIPLVGAVIGAAIRIISSIVSVDDDAEDLAYCQSFLSGFRPKGTGSLFAGGGVVPADLFAPVHKIPKDANWGGRGNVAPGKVWGFVRGADKYASALGCALMAITEWAPADPRDVDFKKLAKMDHERGLGTFDDFAGEYWNENMWWKHVSRVIRESRAAYVDEYPGKRQIGPSKKRRAQFRKLRRAIRAQHGPSLPKGAVSDGGASLWTSYLDLLRDEVRAGHITKRWIAFQLQWVGASYNYFQLFPGMVSDPDHVNLLPMFGTEEEYHAEGQDGRGCPSVLADQIFGLVGGWATSVEPFYAAGQAEIDRMKTAANEIARVAGEKAKASKPPKKPKVKSEPDAPAAAEPAAEPAGEDASTGGPDVTACDGQEVEASTGGPAEVEASTGGPGLFLAPWGNVLALLGGTLLGGALGHRRRGTRP